MSLKRRQLLMAGVPLLWAVHRSVHAADLYQDYLNSTSRQPFVSFLGRQGSVSTVGHAFVGVGVRLDATLIVYERLFGLYPKDGALAGLKSVFSPTSGKLDRDWADMAWDTELTRSIDATEKAKILAQFDKWKSSAPKYSLVGNGGANCNSLTGEVARSLGMKVPDSAGTTRPWKFIEALKAAN